MFVAFQMCVANVGQCSLLDKPCCVNSCKVVEGFLFFLNFHFLAVMNADADISANH